MRLKIILEPEIYGKKTTYYFHHYFNKEIKLLVSNFPKDIDEYLCKKGLKIEDKIFSLYTISNLRFNEQNTIEKDGIVINDKGYFYFSTPIKNKKIEREIIKYLETQCIILYTEKWEKIKLHVTNIEKINYTYVNGSVKYKNISPISLGSKIFFKKSMIDINSHKVINLIKNKLLFNYKLIFNREYKGNLHIKFDINKLKKSDIYKHFKVKEITSFKEKTNYIQITNLHLIIECKSEMHKFIFDSGIGYYSNYGFGSVIPHKYIQRRTGKIIVINKQYI